jgi:hypothetical protein
METQSLADRFWPKVERRGQQECWPWLASLRNGYGQIYDGEDWRNPKALYAHRVAYGLMVGPIPKGMQLDHICRDRRCVNPAHLEPVTLAENLARGEGFGQRLYRQKTHCKHGHPFEGDNLYVAPDGHRVCKTCRRAVDQRRSKTRRRPKRKAPEPAGRTG